MTAVPTSAAPATHPPSTTPAIPQQRPEPPAKAPRPRRSTRSTPVRLTATLAVVLVLVVTAGVTAFFDSLDRATVIDEASGQRGRMAIAAFEMYRALSDADSAATSAFLPGQFASTELADDYETGISRASTAITTLADESTTLEQATIVAELSAGLPTYTGLIETARAYHRQGLPLGLAYLRSASALVQEDMLPKIDRLQTHAMADLGDAKGSAAGFPWLAVPACLLALLALGRGQFDLSRTTKRLVNPGAAAATLAVLVLTGWLLVSWNVAAGHINAGHTAGTQPLEALSNAHIDVQQARSNEALTLIAQGANTDYEAEFRTIMTELIGEDGESGVLNEALRRFDDPQLNAYIGDAVDAARDWNTAHVALRELDDGGDYAGAVASAVDTDDGAARIAFDALDTALTAANELAAEKFTTETDAAASALDLTGVGFTVLTAAAMIAVSIGMQRRISEYR
ncbi:hypothetical protein LX16_0875 [Stackebrandtia albiflava]|uniref:Secreted protein n=1 Tax=Stackebrandtia albiflava TaxID=406432 RepID=A0A562VBB9_9ACTN|nr:hypothetical protein [Stackebrandtia albiflava]TWJ15175.1 hypothetical protein LX16_0875 [Stackebrandtia albiflava]